MTTELLALLPGHPDLSRIRSFDCVQASGFTLVFHQSKTKWTFGKALRHRRLKQAAERQAWLETLMSAGTILPFLPGSFLHKSEVEAFVMANLAELEALTRRLENKVQYQVTVTWAEDRVLDHFRSAPEIASLFYAPKLTGPTIAGAVARLQDRLSRSICGHLTSVACEFAELPCDTGGVFNGILLIDAKQEGDLDHAIEAIDALWTEGFHIRQIGPSPATSFASLRVRRYRPEDIEQARKVLAIDARATEMAIRESRQRLLRQSGANVEGVRSAVRLALAARRAGVRDGEIALIDHWSEGRASHLDLEDVA